MSRPSAKRHTRELVLHEKRLGSFYAVYTEINPTQATGNVSLRHVCWPSHIQYFSRYRRPGQRFVGCSFRLWRASYLLKMKDIWEWGYSATIQSSDSKACCTAHAISYPEPSNFFGKDQFLGDPDWLSEMQYNTIIEVKEQHPMIFIIYKITTYINARSDWRETMFILEFIK